MILSACDLNHLLLIIRILYLTKKEMEYYISTHLKESDFDRTIEVVTEELKKEGFGVLTQIDMKATMKQKLDVDINKYQILGACNPPFALKALQLEDKIGLMLPCNVIVQEKDGGVEIAAIDPVASMQAIDNENLKEVSDIVRQKLLNVIEGVNRTEKDKLVHQ